jgi:hypothetical protein
VDGLTKEEASLTKQIKKLGEEVDKYTLTSTEAEELRAKEKEDYEANDKDYEDTVKAIEDAVAAMEEAKTSTESALVQKKLLALVQSPLVLEKLSDDQRTALVAKAEPRPDILAAGNAAEHEKTYNFKSGNVIELLKELQRKFEDDRIEATKAETAAQNAYDLSEQARKAALEAAEAAKAEKEEALGTVQGDLVTAKASLEEAEADLESDENSLTDTKKMCMMKKDEWEERSTLRAHELDAMGAAIKILAKVTGVRTEAPTNPVPPPRPVEAEAEQAELLQANKKRLLAFIDAAGDPRTRAIKLLRTTAHKTGSKSFEEFAEQVATKAAGPFDDLNNMIQKMIFQLMAEQKDEDDHKNWCDLEIEKTNTSATNKEEKIAELDTKIEEAKAKTALLTEEIAAAEKMVADLQEYMDTATKVREAGKKENAEAEKDAKGAQEAIAQAVSVITAHYKESGMIAKESWEFVQKQKKAPVELPENPGSWASGYTGVTDPKDPATGIITVLEEVSSDFAKMEADTLAQEATDQKAYDDDMKDTDIEKAGRTKEAQVKGDEKKRLVDKTTAYEKSRKHTSDELYTVEQYMKDLAPACIEGDSTYEDRKESRDTEIEALKEAQVILASAFEGGPAPAPAAFLAPVRRHQ